MLVQEENKVVREFLEERKFFDKLGLELVGTKNVYDEKVYLVRIKKDLI